jgi:DNA-binding MarR family transcriptional regulator
VLITLSMANALASHVFDRELMRRGLHVTQVGVLELIWRHEPITPTALTELVGHPATTVRDRIDTLARHGYVHRIPNEADRRSYRLATTPEGDRYMRAAVPAIEAAEEQIGRHLGTSFEDYRAQLERLLEAARTALAEASASDPRPTPSSDE